MCLRLVFLLVRRVAAWLRLSRREEAWKTAEILILRHQLAVLQRQQPGRVKLNWADRAFSQPCSARYRDHATRACGYLSARARCCAGTATSSAAAGPPGPCAAGPAGQRPGGTLRPWSDGWPARTPTGDTAGCTAKWPASELRSQHPPSGRSSGPPASNPPGG